MVPMTLYSLVNIFWVVLAVASVVIWWLGGREERMALGAVVVACILTPLVKLDSIGWAVPQPGIAIVDLVALAWFVAIALPSVHFWPMWVAAFQVLGVLSHLTRLVDAEIFWLAYSLVQGAWAYLILGVLLSVVLWPRWQAWRANHGRMSYG